MELSCTESEGSSTVRLVNTGISTDEHRDAQDWGWRGCLDQLERVLGSRTDPDLNAGYRAPTCQLLERGEADA
jgi:hypothetical protein